MRFPKPNKSNYEGLLLVEEVDEDGHADRYFETAEAVAARSSRSTCEGETRGAFLVVGRVLGGQLDGTPIEELPFVGPLEDAERPNATGGWLTRVRPSAHGRAVLRSSRRTPSGRLRSRAHVGQVVREVTAEAPVAILGPEDAGPGRGQLALVNGGHWALPWLEFASAVAEIASSLARALGQEVSVETLSATGERRREVST